MIFDMLLHELESLTRVEKLSVMQLLVEQLAQDEALLTAQEYEV